MFLRSNGSPWLNAAKLYYDPGVSYNKRRIQFPPFRTGTDSGQSAPIKRIFENETKQRDLIHRGGHDDLLERIFASGVWSGDR